MLIQKQESKKHQNSESCSVWEYDFPSESLGLATSYIHGRYPEQDKVTNLECEEMLYAVSGSGTIHSEKGDFVITPGDAYLIEKGEVYWLEGEDLSLLITTVPRWTPEQHKTVV